MSDTNDAKEQPRRGAADAADELIDVSRRIHTNPELAMEARQAAALLSERLEAHGFQVKRGVSWLKTAFSATWGEGPVTIAYLLEYDALPEIGHACGHNLIAPAAHRTASGLPASLPSARDSRTLSPTPAEEGGG